MNGPSGATRWKESILGGFVLLALFVIHPGAAHADGVTTCTRASAADTGLLNCLDALVYQSLPISDTTLVLTCPSGVAGLQDQSRCTGNVWKLRSAIAATELVGYCAQAVMVPYSVCDYPNGKEGYLLASDVFGVVPVPPGPPTVTQPATISWTASTTNTDGTPAVVTGYRIDYGLGNFANSVTTTATSYTFTGLAVGTWQFRVVTLSGTSASQPSGVVTLTITGSCPALPAIVTRTQTCPTGTSGTWTQSHDWTAVAAPACWAATAWLPTSQPAGSCPAATWVVSSTGARPAYEPVLAISGGGVVVGHQDGTVPAGLPCGAEIIAQGTTSYRQINNSDVALQSPTYASRTHIAVCVLR